MMAIKEKKKSNTKQKIHFMNHNVSSAIQVATLTFQIAEITRPNTVLQNRQTPESQISSCHVLREMNGIS